MPALELQALIFENKIPQNFESLLDHFHKLKQVEKNKHLDLVEILYEKPKKRCQQLQTLKDKDKLDAINHPLSGFYISIKDSLRLKGTASTGGFYINLGLKCTENCDTVKSLIKRGAIVTCKGNIP